MVFKVFLDPWDVMLSNVEGFHRKLSKPSQTHGPVFDFLITQVPALKQSRVTHLLWMWRASKNKMKERKKPRNDWSEWCVEACAVHLSATKWLAMPSLCVRRPECILYDSPDVLRTHSWVMYQTEQITPLSSFSPLSRGSPPWPYLFAHFLCCSVCQVDRDATCMPEFEKLKFHVEKIKRKHYSGASVMKNLHHHQIFHFFHPGWNLVLPEAQVINMPEFASQEKKRTGSSNSTHCLTQSNKTCSNKTG